MVEAIELRKTNLYASAVFLQHADGEGQIVRTPIEWKAGSGDQFHQVVEGDELPYIAWKYYGTRTENAWELWWVIADVNNIVDVFNMQSLVGEDLLIPNYDKLQLLL